MSWRETDDELVGERDKHIVDVFVSETELDVIMETENVNDLENDVMLDFVFVVVAEGVSNNTSEMVADDNDGVSLNVVEIEGVGDGLTLSEIG